MTALQAIKDRNPEALMDAFGSVEEAKAFKSEILPQLSPADCKWFWQEVMEPEQLEATLNAVRDVCLRIASRNGLKLGVDFNADLDAHGHPVMVLDQKHHQVFYKELPADRHSVLRFYLQTK